VTEKVLFAVLVSSEFLAAASMVVSSIGTHLGAEIEIDAVSDTQTVIGAILTMLNPIVGLAILADSLIGNHATASKVTPFKPKV
jgi:hypothetical protein